jgi:hypothetical protein
MTETLEELHLWLATRLPELREIGAHAKCKRYKVPHCWVTKDPEWIMLGERFMPHRNCRGQGWMPNITTNKLLPELLFSGWIVEFAKRDRDMTVTLSRDWDDDGEPSQVSPVLVQNTSLPLALCRAAKLALEASA